MAAPSKGSPNSRASRRRSLRSIKGTGGATLRSRLDPELVDAIAASHDADLAAVWQSVHRSELTRRVTGGPVLGIRDANFRPRNEPAMDDWQTRLLASLGEDLS
jgi:hypothetical protein